MRPRKYVDDEGRLHKLKVDKRRLPSHCGKDRHSSRKLAKAAAKAAARDLGEPVEAYHCQPCHAWHIGHPPGWQYEQHRLDHQAA